VDEGDCRTPLATASADCATAHGMSSIHMSEMAALRVKLLARQKFAKQKLTYAGDATGSSLSTRTSAVITSLGATPPPKFAYKDGNTGFLFVCTIEVGPRWMCNTHLESPAFVILAPTRSLTNDYELVTQVLAINPVVQRDG